MPLSEKTLAEMAVGAATVAAHAGKHGIEPEYMDSMLRTQQRASFLQSLAREGKIRIERKIRPRTNDKLSGPDSETTVYVGLNPFSDPSGELVGAWPSEVLVAQVAMALAAGEGEKEAEPDKLTSVGGRTFYVGEEVNYDPVSDLFYTKNYSWTKEEYTKLCVAYLRS